MDIDDFVNNRITPRISPKLLDVPTKHMQELALRCMFF